MTWLVWLQPDYDLVQYALREGGQQMGLGTALAQLATCTVVWVKGLLPGPILQPMAEG